jgi:hypothetical protein
MLHSLDMVLLVFPLVLVYHGPAITVKLEAGMTVTAPVLTQQQPQYHRIPPDAMAAPMVVDKIALVREKNRQHAKDSRMKKKAVLNDLMVRFFSTVALTTLLSCNVQNIYGFITDLYRIKWMVGRGN